MRTDEEIVEKANQAAKEDFFGFSVGDYIECLPYDLAKQFLNEQAIVKYESGEESWKQEPKEEESLKSRIIDYLPFAWDKANNRRGLSAGRSLMHFSAWFWLLGDSAFSKKLAGEYNYYGKKLLVEVSNKVGFDWKKADSDSWQTDESDDGVCAETVLGEAA